MTPKSCSSLWKGPLLAAACTAACLAVSPAALADLDTDPSLFTTQPLAATGQFGWDEFAAAAGFRGPHSPDVSSTGIGSAAVTATGVPQPRSSHDAVVIDGKLYVVGGWLLDGPEEREWTQAALVYDLSAEDGQWQELPAPQFRRRALAAAEWNGKLVVIGGMTGEREVSQRVDLYDPQRRAWTQGPALPDSDRHGFGIAACNLNGSLYVSGALGIVYRLNDPGDSWEEVAELEISRFFHRLVPTPSGNLLAVAGAAHGHGHLASIERIQVQAGEATSHTARKPSAAERSRP